MTILMLLALASFGLVGMAIQGSDLWRNAMLDALPTQLGASAKLRIYTGTPPAAVGDAPTGTLLATLSLPATYFAGASGGVMAKSGTWSGSASAGSGATPGYYRLYNNGETACHEQGSAGIGSGDLNFNGTITSGQTITISAFSLTAGAA